MFVAELVPPAEVAPPLDAAVLEVRALAGGVRVLAEGVNSADVVRAFDPAEVEPVPRRGRGSGAACAGGRIGLDVELVQLVGIDLELRLRLKNHMVLVQLRVHRVDLPLTEGIVECIVDRRGSDTQARGRGAIDHQRDGQAAHLLVGGNIFELRQLLQTRNKTIRPIVQFVLIGIFKRVLILCTADAVIDRDVLHRLHEELNSVHLAEPGLKPADNIRGA